MPLTGAERQAAWRQRRARAEADLAAEAARLRAELAEARDEIGRLAAQACKHPAAAMDGSTCRACDREVW